MLIVNEQLSIPEEELTFTFARSGGPGGQNVNKVASKAILHWNLGDNSSLPADVRQRLRARQRNRVTQTGTLVIQAQEHRDQERNRQACLEKLRAMVLEAATPPKPRRPSKPTRGSKERRLSAKKRRAAIKSTRGRVNGE